MYSGHKHTDMGISELGLSSYEDITVLGGNFMMQVLKHGVSAEDVKIYDLYVQRVKWEGELIWTRFKIFLTFVSGVLIVMGFLIRPYLDEKFLSNIPTVLCGMFLMLSIIGIAFAEIWLRVIKDGRHWQLFMNRIISRVENTIFEQPENALYNEINKQYPPDSKPRSDVVDLSLCVAKIFMFIFAILAVLSVVVLVWKCVTNV